jgi:serine/threonine-protein kinase RIO1
MSDHETRIDLTDPNLKRGQLAEAEQAVILEAFSRDVAAVAGTINDGKEATVYLCRGTEPATLLAAKMYRARKFRAFANERDYMDLAGVRDRRLRKAMQKRSRMGQRASAHLWVNREWQVLNDLHAYGASVPRPFAHCNAGILMEYVGSDRGAAPMLIHADLRGEEADPWRSVGIQHTLRRSPAQAHRPATGEGHRGHCRSVARVLSRRRQRLPVLRPPGPAH